jgi:hypothetical protein
LPSFVLLLQNLLELVFGCENRRGAKQKKAHQDNKKHPRTIAHKSSKQTKRPLATENNGAYGLISGAGHGNLPAPFTVETQDQRQKFILFSACSTVLAVKIPFSSAVSLINRS